MDFKVLCLNQYLHSSLDNFGAFFIVGVTLAG